MGYRWPIRFEDAQAETWVGEHRPELADLRPLFLELTRMRAAETLEPEAWRAVMPDGAQFIRALGPRTAHIRLRGAAVPDVVIKLIPPRTDSRWRWLTEQARHSRSRRAYLWAHRLRALGIETPRPLGFLERSARPALDKSFGVSEYIYAPSLIEIRDTNLEALERRGGALVEKRVLIQRIAELTRELHARGLCHADLHGGNLLVADGAVFVIDLESMRRRSRNGFFRNLVRLNRDFLDTRLITRTDRMRFLDTYLRHATDRLARRRELFKEIAAQTEQKLAERGERFHRGSLVTHSS